MGGLFGRLAAAWRRRREGPAPTNEPPGPTVAAMLRAGAADPAGSSAKSPTQSGPAGFAAAKAPVYPTSGGAAWRTAPAVPAVDVPLPLPFHPEPAAEPAKRANPARRTLTRPWPVIAFAYEDADGRRSSREVEAHLIEGSLLHGWCLLRDEARTFHLDRILGEVTDTGTGEMMRPEEWARRWGG
jgi:hypothetical protein